MMNSIWTSKAAHGVMCDRHLFREKTEKFLDPAVTFDGKPRPRSHSRTRKFYGSIPVYIDYVFILCEAHSQMTGNINFEDNLLNAILSADPN